VLVVKLPDALVLLGLLLLATGLALWSVPLMLVVVGAVLMGAGVWSHVRGGEAAGSAPPVPAAAEEESAG
jgi:hypothetical protein